MTQIINAMTVDVEDYFQVSAFANHVDYNSWAKHESRVEKNTYKLLDMFDMHSIKITFFVLGWIAERYPQLVKEIVVRGHELASHGYSHRLIYNQKYDEFRSETVGSKKILEDIGQVEVQGYRAASYSITNNSQWALDILIEAGFKYDSSIFPVRHDRYGILGTPRFPYRLTAPNGGEIVEFPISTKKIAGYNLPIAGGGYFRLFPYALTRFALNSINQSENKPFIFYLHPWEVDPDQPKISANLLSKFRHYNNLHKCETRLNRLLHEFKFSTVKEVIKDYPLEEHSFSLRVREAQV